MAKDIKSILEAHETDWEADRPNRDNAYEDQRFLGGDQWPDQVRMNRERAGRPCPTVNRLGQFVRQIAGDMRQSNPSCEVYPVDSDGDKEMADIYEGLIRQIEYQSGAAQTYSYGAECASGCGIGHWRIVTDFVDDSAFDQDIFVSRIEDPLSVVWDADARKLDRSDAKRCVVTSLVTREAYKAKFGEEPPDDFPYGYSDIGRRYLYWQDADKVRIAEYWCVEEVDGVIGLLQTGETISLDKFKPAQYQFLGLATGSGSSGDFRIRKVKRPKIEQYIVNGAEILEGPNDWAGSMIPIIPCIGSEVNIDGYMHRKSIIRDSKDAQRLYNYWRATAAEAIALAPKSPWMVTPTMLQGYEGMWNQANTATFPYLVYNPDPSSPDGKPYRNPGPEPPAAMWQEAQIAQDDMKATTGIYDAALGAQSNETSGKAILAREKQGDTGNFVFFDNFNVAIRRTGQILIDLIPKIYDSDRVVRVLDKEEVENFVPINRVVQLGMGMEPIIINDLSAGRFDVRVKTGPNFTTAREQAREEMAQIMTANPEAFMLIADLYFENSDFPGAESIAERFKKMLPPGLVPPEEGGAQPPQDPMADPMMQAMARLEAMEKQVGIEKTAAETEKIKAQTVEIGVDTQKEAATPIEDPNMKNAMQMQMNREKLGSSERMSREKTASSMQMNREKSQSSERMASFKQQQTASQ